MIRIQRKSNKAITLITEQSYKKMISNSLIPSQYTVIEKFEKETEHVSPPAIVQDEFIKNFDEN